MTAARWQAIALDRVRRDDVANALRDVGIPWDHCGHVAATQSLAGAIQDHGDSAIPISTLIDFAVWPGMPGGWSLEPPALAPATDSEGKARRRAQLSIWQGLVSGRLLGMDLRTEGTLRQLARGSHIPPAVGRSLVAGRRQFMRGVRQLIASGFRPQDVRSGDTTLDAASAAWKAIEEAVPPITQVRDDLWLTGDTIATRHANVEEIKDRVLAALASALGFDPSTHTIVHHGFHFYTPVQWALFRTLRHVCAVDQVFIIHDDGHTPAFESWRRFFDPSLDMPLAQPTPTSTSTPLSPGSVALQDALGGRQVDTAALSGTVEVHAARNVAELARLLGQLAIEANTNGRPEPEVYAPAAGDVDRSIRRLTGSAEVERAALGHLPVGTFLLSLHRCLGRDGQPSVEADDLLEMAATGFLQPHGPAAADTPRLASFRRAMDFFDDCRSPEIWRGRAALLVDLVEGAVAGAGGRRTGPALARVEAAIDNPLLRVPWLDITPDDAHALQASIEHVLDLVESIARLGRRSLRDHMELIEKYLKTGLATADEEERARLEAQISGLRTGVDEEVDVEALVDVINVLLGREVESDLLGHDADRSRRVGDVLFLDARGYAPAERDIHVTNLSDSAFPRRTGGLDWPFRVDALDPNAALGISSAILETRIDTGTASDLYLLWLALDGVTGAARVHLSYVERLKGQPQNPSPAISLLTRPQGVSESVADHVAGIPIGGRAIGDDGLSDPARCMPMPDVVAPVADIDVARARLLDIDHRALASAEACPRRLAIQWLFGDSAAFTAAHHHAMLHGNVRAALITRGLLDETEATRVVDAAWEQLTEGQRRSSREKKRVRDADVDRFGADWTWLLTLSGSKQGTDRLSAAYQRAMRPRVDPGVEELAEAAMAEVPVPLPPGLDALVEDGELSAEEAQRLCTSCPVNSRCRVRVAEGS